MAGPASARASSWALPGRGARVIAWDVNDEGLAQTADEAASAGLTVHTAHIDVTDEVAVKAATNAIVAEHGKLDAVFINAGVAGRAGPAIDMDLDNWRKVHAVNLDGAFITAQAAAVKMKAAGCGKIVFTASVWGIRGARRRKSPPTCRRRARSSA
ncbi:SDR family NAD(P)-dependent oxidoreductase [Novosphingobium colocasiae]